MTLLYFVTVCGKYIRLLACHSGPARRAVTLAAHVFFDKIGKIHENTRKIRKILRYITYLLWSLNILC